MGENVLYIIKEICSSSQGKMLPGVKEIVQQFTKSEFFKSIFPIFVESIYSKRKLQQVLVLQTRFNSDWLIDWLIDWLDTQWFNLSTYKLQLVLKYKLSNLTINMHQHLCITFSSSTIFVFSAFKLNLSCRRSSCRGNKKLSLKWD